MISSGLFILPGIIYSQVGPGIIFSYLLASVFMIPAMLAKTELATAMPKAGGAYFYINKSIGPFIGTFSGLTSWFSLALKSAFALIGIGIFVTPFFPESTEITIKLIAVAFTIIFTGLNILGVKASGKFQVVLVFILISLLIFYNLAALPQVSIKNLTPMLPNGFSSVVYTSSVIFISFGGLTKIASVAEEIKDPGRTIPRGMFSAFFVVTSLYLITLLSTAGILTADEFSSSLIPISDGAAKAAGFTGYILLSIAAVTAFITTANAGIMAASRTPLAMAEDHLLPGFFQRVNPKTGTPIRSIIVTAVFMISVIFLLDIEKLVKAASTMMLILFSLNCIAIILMRESRISTYRPLFKMPLYPYLPLAGSIIYIYLILDMGLEPLIITGAFFLFSIIWYLLYSRKRAAKDSALIHVVKNITNKKITSDELDIELKQILIQRDDIVEDRFDKIISEAEIIDLPENSIYTFNDVFSIISSYFSQKFNKSEQEILDLLLEREADSTTVITKGLAIPHIIIEGKKDFDILILRSKVGIKFPNTLNNPVHQIFALAGTKDERNFHLQALMAIAQIVQNEGFAKDWLAMKDFAELKNLILLAKRARQNSI
ncbi:MAG: amino acid permease [Bacteroidetes bacterium]|nr:amino acid permease [Bacteroidota bacterium]